MGTVDVIARFTEFERTGTDDLEAAGVWTEELGIDLGGPIEFVHDAMATISNRLGLTPAK